MGRGSSKAGGPKQAGGGTASASINPTASASGFTQDGETNPDGSMKINYLHIANQNTPNYGSTYGQDIEPSGEYMSLQLRFKTR